MGTLISNPASFSSVRAACTAEGYGSNTAMSAYRRGGGITPDHANTAGISTTAAGLRLSQFSGVTIPSPIAHHVSTINSPTRSGSVTDGVAPPTVMGATSTIATVSIVSGGVGPYTYSWALVSGDSFTINSPNAASTSFGASHLCADPPAVYTGVYRCTITDTGDSNYQTTQDVTVTLTYFYAP